MKNKGLTVVEMLTVLVIMAVLVSLIIPASVQIINMAKETKQKAQFAAISIGMESFRNDNGDYPPSDCLPRTLTNLNPAASSNGNGDYCGSQKLTEAMVGYDLFGFHPKSKFISTGKWGTGTNEEYDKTPTTGNLDARKGPYVNLEQMDVVLLADGTKQIGYYTATSYSLVNQYVICDTFKKYNNNLKAKVGTPILYFRAYKNRIEHDATGNSFDQIYDFKDNRQLIYEPTPDGKTHLLTPAKFYSDEYIRNMKLNPGAAVGKGLPYNKDSFILISAGKDGLYGTDDDIFNFDKE